MDDNIYFTNEYGYLQKYDHSPDRRNKILTIFRRICNNSLCFVAEKGKET